VIERRRKAGGAEGIRTPDPHNAIVVLYQLSYDPSQMERQSRLRSRFVKRFESGDAGVGTANCANDFAG
jgi:hypothetical protein